MKKVGGISVLAALLLLPLVGSSASAKDKAALTLDWFPLGYHMGIFAAKDRGLYDRADLDVDIPRGFGSGDTVKRVGAKGTEAGLADLPTAIVGRAKGTLVTSVGVLFDRGTNAIVALKGKGVKTPKDLEGKTFGDAAATSTRTLLPAFMKANGIQNYPSVALDPAAKYPSLVAGKVDSIGTLTILEGSLRGMAKKAGDDIVMFAFSDYGVDVYGHAFLVHDDLLKEKPDLLRRLMHATYEGIAWAVENPEEASALFQKRVPTISLESIRGEWSVTLRSLLTDFAKKNGIGHIEERKMAYTIGTMTELMTLPRRVAPSEMYTNQFLPKLFPKEGK